MRAMRSSPAVLMASLSLALLAGCNCDSITLGSDAGTGGGAATGGGVATGGGATGGGVATGGGAATDGGTDAGIDGGTDAGPCTGVGSCSADGKSVLDCSGAVVTSCSAAQTCDPTTLTCVTGCQAAANARGSTGCDFFAVNMEQYVANLCFAVYVVNGSATPAHLSVDYQGNALSTASFTRIPSGTGAQLSFNPYDPVSGLAPGQAAVLFLAGSAGSAAPCPVATAVPVGSQLAGTAVGTSFHITSDAPVSAFEVNPWGGGAAGTTGSSLLLPTSAWGTNYLLTSAGTSTAAGNPSLDLVASQDNTQVTLLPSATIAGGGTVMPGAANTPMTVTLNKGQTLQLSQAADLTGSLVQADHPIGVLAGNVCLQQPAGTFYCDHAEQMLPPVSALGHEYVAAMFRPRATGDQAFWRLVGAVDGTLLTYASPPLGAPTSLSAGQVVEFPTDQPFTVQSQDAAHPFFLFAMMTGSAWSGLAPQMGYGDPEFVMAVPVQQFDTSYWFMADPTFPENDVVVVRSQNAQGTFDDVTLDCAGVLTGWQTIGTAQWTRVDLLRHDFQPQGNCSAGAHHLASASPFSASIWGWGTPETTSYTANVSYGYPAGMKVRDVNSLVLAPTPH